MNNIKYKNCNIGFQFNLHNYYVLLNIFFFNFCVNVKVYKVNFEYFFIYILTFQKLKILSSLLRLKSLNFMLYDIIRKHPYFKVNITLTLTIVFIIYFILK